MWVIAKQTDFQHPPSQRYNFSVLTCINSPNCHQKTVKSLATVRSFYVMSESVCPISMSLSSRLMVSPYLIESFAYDLGINCYILQYSSKKHLIEGDGSILKFMLTKIVYNNHCRKSKSKELLFEIIS